jgi:hypothetical protein
VQTRFVGALHFQWIYFSGPTVELQATTDALTFKARFGVGYILGPWIASREEVAKIRASRHFWEIGTGIEFHLVDGRRWTFWVITPGPVLINLHKLGYPVTLPPWYPLASPAKDLG